MYTIVLSLYLVIFVQTLSFRIRILLLYIFYFQENYMRNISELEKSCFGS